TMPLWSLPSIGTWPRRCWPWPGACGRSGSERLRLHCPPRATRGRGRRASRSHVREGFLEPPEFEAVCGYLPSYVHDTARFAYLTGWRIGAIRALEWCDVDLRAQTLQLRAASAKNKRAKLLPLRGALLALIERRAAARDLACPFVFPGAAGGRLGDFRKAWKRACPAAGVRGIVFHDLRRSGARNAVRSGVPEQVVMELGGWRTRAVFGRYNITSERDLADAIERVSQYVADRAADVPKIRPLQ